MTSQTPSSEILTSDLPEDPGPRCSGQLPEPEDTRGMSGRLDALRAGVMGANDGIVSTAGLVVGVAGAAVSDAALLAAGVAGLVAGALSMAVGEYVSVSSRRDSERAVLRRQRSAIDRHPAGEMHQLAALVAQRGVDPELACRVSQQLSRGDAVEAHARFRFGLDPGDLTNPWRAGLASMVSFVVGALIPLVTIVLAPRSLAVLVTALAVVAALAVTGVVSAQLGGAPRLRAVLRTVGGGALAMTITFVIGSLLGTQL